jgi:hypothetical protein
MKIDPVVVELFYAYGVDRQTDRQTDRW